ncbi:MAG: hypothetical protein ACO1SX_08905 [Actinomycetota bacterium]
MKLDWWLQWWNAFYTVPLAFVLVLLAITSILSLLGGAFGELGHSEHEVESGVACDHDLGVDHDVDHDLDLHHDHGGDADLHAHPGLMVSALLILGAGNAPVMLLLQIFLLLWGLIGVGLHQAMGVNSGFGLLWSAPVALTLSVLGTRGAAQLFGRFLKPQETSAVKRGGVVGRVGRVVYPVTQEEGTVHVRDSHGTLHRLRARAPVGRLESGQEIVILGYDSDSKVYQVDDATVFVDRP